VLTIMGRVQLPLFALVSFGLYSILLIALSLATSPLCPEAAASLLEVRARRSLYRRVASVACGSSLPTREARRPVARVPMLTGQRADAFAGGGRHEA